MPGDGKGVEVKDSVNIPPQGIDYEQSLTSIGEYIADLDLTEQDKEKIGSNLSVSFYQGLESYIKDENNRSTVDDTKSKVINFLNSYVNQGKDINDDGYKCLVEFAQALGLQENDGKWVETTVDKGGKEKESDVDMPQLELKGILKVKAPVEGETPVQDFRSGVKKEEPKEGESVSEDLQLYARIKDINDLKVVIGKLKSDEKIGEEMKTKLGDIEKVLDNILQVTEHTTPNNVKALQKYIYENVYKSIDESESDIYRDKKEFEEKNYMSRGFDGRFGKSTLKGLKALLDKIDTYVKGLETISEKQKDEGDKGQTGEGTGDTKETDDPVSDVDARKVEGVRDSIQTSEPLVLSGDNYPVAADSQTLASSLNLNGLTFYTTGKLVQGQTQAETVPDSIASGREGLEGYKKYYVKKGNDVYEIEVNGNKLFPIAQKVGGEKVLIQDNPACIRYLQSQAPDGCTIGRSDKYNNYVFISHERGLTIEPMTIDGNWVSPKLSDCLLLLNFTNFLRSDIAKIEGDVVMKGNFPDLRLEDNKLQVRVKKKSNNGEKWYEVPAAFGLEGINNDVLLNFIKYNNSEDWKDNWEKKSGNNYERVKIEDEVEVTQQSATPVVAQNPVTGEELDNQSYVTSTDSLVSKVNSPMVGADNNGGATFNEGSGDIPVSQHEIPKDQFEMSVDELAEMNNTLGAKKFIEIGSDDKITYDMDMLKNYLGEFRGGERSKLKNNATYILAVQILLNEKAGNDGGKINLNGKYLEETKDRVKAFQENYNVNLPKGGVKLVPEDGIPGKDTLAVLLDGRLGDVEFEGLGCYIDGNGNLQLSEGSTLKTGTDENGKYLEVDGQKYYECNERLNGLGYDYSFYLDNIGWLEMCNYVNGKREGQCTVVWADGDKYEGNYKNDIREGHGTFTYANGNNFEGIYENGNIKSGEFTIKSNNSEKVYDVVGENDLLKIIGPEGDVNLGKYIDKKDGGKIIDNPPSS